MQEVHPIRNIICGRFHNIIYKDNGDVLVFGQLGLGHISTISTPILLMNDKNIRNIICGGDNGDILGFGFWTIRIGSYFYH